MTFLTAAQETLSNGGGTFTAEGRTVYKDSGYFIGGLVPSLVLPLDGLTAQSLALALASFVARHSGTFSEYGVLLGTWIDGNKVYIDATEYRTGYESVLPLVRQRKQLAIWDIVRNMAIGV
jgi:hypothetical protein